MFSDPAKNIKSFELEKGMKVADVGAGSGFYAIEAAKAVGGLGRVYAIDVQKDLLDRLRNNARKTHALNIEIVWGDIEKPGGTKLANSSVDAAILSNTLFQIADKKTISNEIRRILKPKGKFLLIDWMDSFGGMGPASDQVVRKEDARKLFEGAGFVVEREIPAGVHHFGMIFRAV